MCSLLLKFGRDDQAGGINQGFGGATDESDFNDACLLHPDVGEAGRVEVPSTPRPPRMRTSYMAALTGIRPRSNEHKSRSNFIVPAKWHLGFK